MRYLHTNLEIEETFLGKVNKTELSSPGKMTATGQYVQKSEGKSQSSKGKVEMMDSLCLTAAQSSEGKVEMMDKLCLTAVVMHCPLALCAVLKPVRFSCLSNPNTWKQLCLFRARPQIHGSPECWDYSIH